MVDFQALVSDCLLLTTIYSLPPHLYQLCLNLSWYFLRPTAPPISSLFSLPHFYATPTPLSPLPTWSVVSLRRLYFRPALRACACCCLHVRSPSNAPLGMHQYICWPLGGFTHHRSLCTSMPLYIPPFVCPDVWNLLVVGLFLGGLFLHEVKDPGHLHSLAVAHPGPCLPATWPSITT